MHFLRYSLLLLAMAAAGCSAQQPSVPADVQHRIESQLRHRFKNIPPDVAFQFGERKASEFSGYDQLAITLVNGDKKSTLQFLINRENSSMMVRPEKIDIAVPYQTSIDVKGRPVRGNPAAKVAIINFDDYQCPFCAEMHKTLSADIPMIYGDRVKIIYKDFPLTEIHPWAIHAQVDANCLAGQKPEAYWEFNDYVHANRVSITVNEKNEKNAKQEKRPLVEQHHILDEQAQALGRKHNLDTTRLDACIKKQDESMVKASMKEGDELGVDSTPTLFINGEKLTGALPLEVLRTVIDRALRQEGVPVPEEPKVDKPAKTEAPSVKK